MTHSPRTVVVGIDGSPATRSALEHAAAHARARAAELVVVHAWQPVPLYDAPLVVDPAEVEAVERAVLTAAQAHLGRVAPDVVCTTRLVQDRTASALLDAARSADLVVLGGHAGSSARLGPVLPHVVGRASCPVLMVPAGAPVGPGPVVVGVDGSPVSVRAVAVAFEEASRAGSPLVAVLAVTPAFDAYVPGQHVLDQLRERGDRELAQALAGACERHPDVAVSRVVSLDAPLAALREQAAQASLLVVGSHGRGALARTVLGSVSSSLLRSAPCPVLVVRPAQAPQAARATALSLAGPGPLL